MRSDVRLYNLPKYMSPKLITAYFLSDLHMPSLCSSPVDVAIHKVFPEHQQCRVRREERELCEGHGYRSARPRLPRYGAAEDPVWRP